MTSHDSVQLDMIQLTLFYDPAKFFLKQGIFELLWTNSLIQGVIDSRFQGHITTKCDSGIEADYKDHIFIKDGDFWGPIFRRKQDV